MRINNFSISGAKRFGLEVSSDKGVSRDITVSNTWTRDCGDCGMAFQTAAPSGVGLTMIKVTHCASHGNVAQRSLSHNDVLRVKGYEAVQFYASPSTTPVGSGAVVNCTVYLDKNGSHLPGEERYGLAAINNNEANYKVQGTRFVTLDGVRDVLAYQPTPIKLDLNTWWSSTPDQ